MQDDARAEAVLREAMALAADASNERVVVRTELELALPRLLRGELDAAALQELAERAVDVFRRYSDERGLGRAWLTTAGVQGPFLSRWDECARSAEKALASYVASGLSPTPCVALQAMAAEHGREPAAAAQRRCERLIARARDDTITRSHMAVYLASLCAMRGDFARARALLGEARAFVELQRALPSHDWVMRAAYVETLAGDVASAEAVVREACERLGTRGDATWLATFTAVLAEVVYLQDRFEEAHELAGAAADLAHRDDVLTQAIWRRVGARTAARAGDASAALALAAEANELLDETDALNLRADTRLAGAEALALSSRRDDAVVAAEQGLALLRRKGNVAGLRRARARLDLLGIGTRRG
jgi:ATP/maltotriose-dependent transcriptional regulator MalT